MDISIAVMILMGILIISQFVLAIRQIKRGAPDGKIILTIDIIIFVLFTPLSICKLIYNTLPVKIAWFVVAFIYMIFSIWYTNMLSKSFKNK